MITFETSQETHVAGVVATLAKLYNGQPVTATEIGLAYGMGHHQVLVYLHMAKDAGQATPVFSNPGGVIRGWVPAGVEVKHTLAEQRAMQAADAVKHLFAGKPVTARVVARHLDRPEGSVARWLDTAKRMKLIRRPPSGYGWMPI
ncbi:MAG: hypothetical protein RIC55_24695 [Pirellulaceae bacterium]